MICTYTPRNVLRPTLPPSDRKLSCIRDTHAHTPLRRPYATVAVVYLRVANNRKKCYHVTRRLRRRWRVRTGRRRRLDFTDGIANSNTMPERFYDETASTRAVGQRTRIVVCSQFRTRLGRYYCPSHRNRPGKMWLIVIVICDVGQSFVKCLRWF